MRISQFDKIQQAKSDIESIYSGDFPRTLIVTGTGLSEIVHTMDICCEIAYNRISHFPISTVKSHTGSLFICSLQDTKVAILAGRWHYYEGYSTKELTLPIRVMKTLGVKNVLFTNVAGGVNPSYSAGDIVAIKDHINFMPDHPLRGHNDERLGVRFPDMLRTYDMHLRQKIQQAASTLGLSVQEGVYFALQGPSLETPAEYKMIHILGGDLVGMSTVPEVIVARHAKMKIAALSIISNVCYPPEKITETTIEDVIAVANEASPKLFELIKKIIVT